MATITVFSFEIFNRKNDIYELAKGMITEKDALIIPEARIILSTAKKIDDSELSQSKRYYDDDGIGAT